MNALFAGPLPALALQGLALIALLAGLTWIASVVRRDVSLVDRLWPAFIAGAALVYHQDLPGGGARSTCLLALVLAWAVRLGIYLTHRNWGRGEDRRYARIRERHEPNFALKSLVLIFALQAVVAWILGWPLLLGLAREAPLAATDLIGGVIALVGLAFETIGDAQLARFKSDPAHAGQVMDRGLWRWTRHPNYFGEACFWWGIWLVCAGGAGLAGAWTLISPLMMTWLLLQVSGVRLLEADLGESRPAYRDYIARTSAFLPWPPRRLGPTGTDAGPRWVTAVAATVSAFLLLDAMWLSTMSARLYRPALGPLLAATPDWIAAAAFYPLYLAGVVVFAVAPALRGHRTGEAAARGAFLGLVAYATYDLTNQATLRDWPWAVTFADLAWGMTATAVAAAIGALAGRRRG